MLAAPKLEYADFHLVDPTRLAQGVQAATVMTIGGLMRGSYLDLEGTPAQIGAAMNHNLADLSHSVAGRRRLLDRANEAGAWQFYFCSRCGARLSPRQCLGCRRRYEVPLGTFGGRQATMPRKVTVYATQQGHQFERQR